MDTEPFLKPRLNGPRFSGGVIPLQVLSDLSILEEMLKDVAKSKYRANHLASRIPSGFLDGVSFNLTHIEDGSAVPSIALVIASFVLYPAPVRDSFESAKVSIVSAIDAAGHGESPVKYLTPDQLGYFGRFGKSLEDGESIEFALQDGELSKPVLLTKKTRERLVQASSKKELTKDVVVYGAIPDIVQTRDMFWFVPHNGQKIKAPLTNQYFDQICDSLKRYKDGGRVRMHAIGKFNLSNKLKEIEAIKQLEIMDPLDIPARIDELRPLKPGWLEGEGVAFSSTGLDWLTGAFGDFYSSDLPLPHLYPSPEGGVLAEWSINPHEASLEIDLAQHTGEWNTIEMTTKTTKSESFNLAAQSEWLRLNEAVRKIASEKQ